MNGERFAIQSAGTLTIRLFGAFAIEKNGTETPRARTRKEQSLLALLILRHASALDRDWLAGVLWPDSGEQQALYNLRRSLSNLREILGTDALRLSSPTPRSVRLDLADAQIDVLAFDAALKRNEEEALERAVALYRGPLLEGFGDAWITPERTAREQAYLDARETLAAFAQKRQDNVRAIHHLRAVIQTDPLRETAQRALLQALLSQGDLASAADAYHRFRLLLHRELHTEPAPETAALYQQVKARLRSADNPASAPTAHRALRHHVSRHFPRLLSSRVGREEDIAAVSAKLQSARLVTLTGTGGIGKTRLALEVAEQVAPRYADGVWFAALSEIYEAERIPSFLVSVFGLTEDREQEPLEIVRRFLNNRTLLLILDNCEHLIEACAPLAERLLLDCPGLTLLATSRQSLGVPGESLWRVSPLELPLPKSSPVPFPDESLGLTESERLFQERAQLVAPNFQITSKNRNAVAQICRLVEGIPFAIELAAAWMRALPVEQLASRLSRQRLLLTGNRRTSQPRQQTLRATLDWSFCLLEEAEQRLLCRLAVFAGGCNLEAAEAVCGEAKDAPGAVLGLLAQLVDKSLIVFSEEEEEARYRLLEMTREYAGEQLTPSERQQAQRKHAVWFLHLAERSLEKEDLWNLSASWYGQIAREYENFHAALLWLEAMESDPSDGLRLAAILWRCWMKSSHLREGRAVLTRLLEKSARMVSIERGRALYGAGVLAADQSDYALASMRFEEALEISRVLGAEREAADCLLQLGVIARDRGEYAAAQTLLEQSFAARCSLPNPGDITPTLISLGNVACDLGDYALAHSRYMESLNRSRQSGKQLSIAYALRALGSLEYQQGRYEEASAWYVRCRAVFQELEQPWGVAYTCNRLGTIAALRGDLCEARRLIQEALRLWQDIQDDWGVALANISLGLLAVQEDDFPRARTLYGESLQLAYRLDNRAEMCQLLERLGCLAAQEEAWERAVILLSAAEAERLRLGLPVPHLEQGWCAQAWTQIRAAVDDSMLALWQEQGTNLGLEHIIAYACTEGVSLPAQAMNTSID